MSGLDPDVISQHYVINKRTYTPPDSDTKSHVDHIPNNGKCRSYLQDVNACRAPDIASGHNVVIVNITLTLRKTKGVRKGAYISFQPELVAGTKQGGVLFTTFPSRSQARIKEDGWRMVPAALKTPGKHMIDNARRKSNARKSPSSERPRPRPNVPVCEGLPQQRRLRIKKRAKTQNLHVRFMTANMWST